jgi:hypothetical protein
MLITNHNNRVRLVGGPPIYWPVVFNVLSLIHPRMKCGQVLHFPARMFR